MKIRWLCSLGLLWSLSAYAQVERTVQVLLETELPGSEIPWVQERCEYRTPVTELSVNQVEADGEWRVWTEKAQSQIQCAPQSGSSGLMTLVSVKRFEKASGSVIVTAASFAVTGSANGIQFQTDQLDWHPVLLKERNQACGKVRVLNKDLSGPTRLCLTNF